MHLEHPRRELCDVNPHTFRIAGRSHDTHNKAQHTGTIPKAEEV